MRLFNKCILYVAFFLVHVVCFAWGLTGHRVVAQVAQDHISDETRLWLSNYGVSDLAWESNWADEIKSDKSVPKHKDWHYLHAKDISKAKGRLFEGIRHSQNVLADPNRSAAEKRNALRWIIHLIADLHQPLHVTEAQWRGYNGCMVKFFSPNSVTSLHTVWDSKLIDYQKLSYSEWARWVQADTVPIKENVELAQWAKESYELGAKIIPGDPEKYCKLQKNARISRSDMPFLGWKYIYDVTPILKERLYKAGVRLALVLEESRNNSL